MSTLTDTYTLSNGVEIPKIGLGTWMMDDDEAEQAVRDAIGVGYRNIDTAQAYGNEHGVGKGVRASGVAREDLFVSSKLAAEIKDYDAAAVKAIEESLAKLDIGYIDLMLIHAPQPWDDFRGGNYDEGNRAAWRALEEAHQAGKLRAIGVSNFLEQDVQNIIDGGTVVPHVNQLLVHAGNTPTDLLAFLRGQGHPRRGVLAHRARRGPRQRRPEDDGRQVRRLRRAAVCPLRRAARHRRPAEDREPGAHGPPTRTSTSSSPTTT